MIDTLEQRRLLASLTDGILNLGSSGNDVISFLNVVGQPDRIAVRENGHDVQSFERAAITSIRADLGAGDDYLDMSLKSVGIDIPAFIFGGEGRDTIIGGAGNDTVYGGSGPDDIRGGSGDDFLQGGGGRDTIRAGLGNDEVVGGRGDDDVYGGEGNDLLRGNEENDVLRGLAGDDTIYGGHGDDRLGGGSGNDFLSGLAGLDTLTGGLGSDVFAVAPGDFDVLVDPDVDTDVPVPQALLLS